MLESGVLWPFLHTIDWIPEYYLVDIAEGKSTRGERPIYGQKWAPRVHDFPIVSSGNIPGGKNQKARGGVEEGPILLCIRWDVDCDPPRLIWILNRHPQKRGEQQEEKIRHLDMCRSTSQQGNTFSQVWEELLVPRERTSSWGFLFSSFLQHNQAKATLFLQNRKEQLFSILRRAAL
jgi:hypothetical protein